MPIFLSLGQFHFGEDQRSRYQNVVFAIVDGKPIGMVTFVQRGRVKNRHIADIFGVYVEKKFREKGIGNRLLRHVISRIKKNDRISNPKAWKKLTRSRLEVPNR